MSNDYPYADRFPVNRGMPEHGRSREEITAELDVLAAEEDEFWETGRCSGTMYCGDHDHYDFMAEAYARFGHVNVLQREQTLVHERGAKRGASRSAVTVGDPYGDVAPLARSEAPDGPVRQRIFAPEDLLRRGDDGDRAAFVVTSLVGTRGRTERRLVTTGRTRIDGWIEVVDGLRVGDLLIADPPEDLEPNDRIRVVGEQTTRNGG